jgi:hypothetical protein
MKTDRAKERAGNGREAAAGSESMNWRKARRIAAGLAGAILAWLCMFMALAKIWPGALQYPAWLAVYVTLSFGVAIFGGIQIKRRRPKAVISKVITLLWLAMLLAGTLAALVLQASAIKTP